MEVYRDVSSLQGGVGGAGDGGVEEEVRCWEGRGDPTCEFVFVDFYLQAQELTCYASRQRSSSPSTFGSSGFPSTRLVASSCLLPGPADFFSFLYSHGDFFKHHCPKEATHPCFTVSQYAYAVADLQEELSAVGLDATSEVLVLTDELDDEFYKEVKERGWRSIRDGRGVDDSILRKELGAW